ncbi:hypothetical protein Tco_1281159, partial [Tanacetum coccineum]
GHGGLGCYNWRERPPCSKRKDVHAATDCPAPNDVCYKCFKDVHAVRDCPATNSRGSGRD